MLFDLLSLGEPIISKRKITDIIRDFDLPINPDDFFHPIGKKDEINFTDFCYLFKSSSDQGEVFLQSFASSFYNLQQ